MSTRLALWSEAFWRAVNPEVDIVGFHRAEPGWISPPRHAVMPDFDLWYVSSGTGQVRVDGSWRAFAPGELLCLPPGSLYEGERAGREDPFQVYYVHLLPFGSRRQRLDRTLAAVWPFSLGMAHRPDIAGLFNQLFESYAVGAGSGRQNLAVKGLATQLLAHVCDELREGSARWRCRPRPDLLQVKALMEQDYAAPLTLADLAAASDLSPNHLCGLFRQQFGVPPIEYLLRTRIREAKVLLARGARVKEVAGRVGFGSQHYFCRQFHRRTGMTPTAFARLHARR